MLPMKHEFLLTGSLVLTAVLFSAAELLGGELWIGAASVGITSLQPVEMIGCVEGWPA